MPNEPQKTDPLKHGYLYAVRLLASSKKSSQELKRRLLEKGYAEPVASEIISRLEQQRVLNDESLVRDALHWALEAKGLGRNRIVYELRKRGVSPQLIQDELSMVPRAKERAIAMSLAKNRWIRLQNIDLRKRKKRVYDFLASRGFDYDLCREVIAGLKDANEDF